MRLVQFLDRGGSRRVGVPTDDGSSLRIVDAGRAYDLALEAIRTGRNLETLIQKRITAELEGYDALLEDNRVLAPLDHPDPAHTVVTLTGLTHLGSARSRDEMHARLEDDASLTDSMKLFKLGLEAGKRQPIGAQPEWAYKGDGTCIVPPGAALARPAYALDGGEEAELVGLYVVGDDGTPYRVGFALGNEYADHVMERQNYLYLAHSKLRACSFGPEMVLGDIPPSITGSVRIIRDGRTVWDGTLETGQANMVHSIANLEHHHFKYAMFRQPGQVHVHFFGASALSTAAGIETQDGDVFDIHSETFGRALRNPLAVETGPEDLLSVQSL